MPQGRRRTVDRVGRRRSAAEAAKAAEAVEAEECRAAP